MTSSFKRQRGVREQDGSSLATSDYDGVNQLTASGEQEEEREGAVQIAHLQSQISDNLVSRVP